MPRSTLSRPSVTLPFGIAGCLGQFKRDDPQLALIRGRVDTRFPLYGMPAGLVYPTVM